MSAELMKSKFVRRPSVRPSVASIIFEVIAWMLSNFSCGFPWAICPDVLFIFDFFRNFFVFVNMGPYGSQNIKRLLLPQISFESFLNFLLSGLHASTVLDFLNFEFPIFNEFLNFTIVPYGETKNLNYLENERP